MGKFLLFILLFIPILIKAQTVTMRGDPVAAAPPIDSGGTTYAIVIGVSSYKYVRPVLHFADRDARVFADFLLSKQGMGLLSRNVMLFTDSNANLNNIGNAISDILNQKLKKGDRVIFYFAG